MLKLLVRSQPDVIRVTPRANLRPLIWAATEEARMLSSRDEFTLCFADRREAGRVLAAKLTACASRDDVLVVGISTGGMVVASEIAEQLHLELGTLLVRRIQAPGHAHVHLGAVAEDGPMVLNPGVIRALHIDRPMVEVAALVAETDLKNTARGFRREHPAADVHGRVVLLVDDGIVTGVTMRAAIAALRERGAAQILVATPVVPALTSDLLKHAVERVVTVAEPECVGSLESWYEEFEPVPDAVLGAMVSARASLALKS